MHVYKSDFLATLHERGFIHQCSDAAGLDAQLLKEPTAAYVGFDATAESLHVGNMVQIMLLHWFEKTGHRPIALMGGGTTMVGDPSGKDETRQLQTREQIEARKVKIRRTFDAFLDFDGPAQMVDNADWLLDLNYVDFLRDYGRHFSVNAMLARDSIKTRLEREQHLSFLEFNYMCLQAYDFVELARRQDCRLQMGGSDQWGNIVSGTDLGRRVGTPQLFALTSHLLTTSSGAKMGKTANGAVWLDADMLPVFDFWQYWRNAEDADVGRFLGFFTTMPMNEVNRLAALEGTEINEAKKVLATEVTALVHGREAAELAGKTARETFEEGRTSAELPSLDVPRTDLEMGVGVLALMVLTGFANTNGEARRHVKGGAVRINDEPVSDERRVVKMSDLTDNGAAKLSFGKKKNVLIRPF
ncbi:tyrosine--tRNA ligase [Rhizobiaceae bacterium]|nr:tyrosine--tRNA ligase [Rhizobiaceae bacterium]